MTSSVVALTLAATISLGQSGGTSGKKKKKKPAAAPVAAKLVKTPAMEKLETDYGATVLVNEPGDGLVSVSITGKKATDAFLADASKIKELDDLLVGSGSITDKGVASLAKATKLRRLFLLKNTKLTKACIADVATLPSLRTLHVSEVDLDKKSLEALVKMPSLRSLLLNRTGLEDADLAALAGNKKLTAINLAGNEDIQGKGLANLHGMSQLTFVDVVGTRASKKQVDDLKQSIKDAGGEVEIRGKGSVGGVAKVPPPK